MNESLFLGQTPYDEFPPELTIPAQLQLELHTLTKESAEAHREIASALVKPADRITVLPLGFGTASEVVYEVYNVLSFVQEGSLSSGNYYDQMMAHIRDRQISRVLEGLRYDGKSLYLLPRKVLEENPELYNRLGDESYVVSPSEEFYGVHHNHLTNGLPSFRDYWVFISPENCDKPTLVITSPVDSYILVKSRQTPRWPWADWINDVEFDPNFNDQLKLESAVGDGEPFTDAQKRILLENCRVHKIGMYHAESSLASFTRC